MKFSYALIEKLVKSKSKDELLDTLLMRSFEAEPVSKDTFNAEIPHNRYSDGASHLGVAREYAAVTGKKLNEPKRKRIFYGDKEKIGGLSIKVEDKKLCPRYGGAYFELTKKGATPAWMRKVLKDCGLRPINPVVDILNYVMLEVGQPLHAFDADKLMGGIIVRRAKNNEEFTTIDNKKFKLKPDVLVIADEEKAQAIAGIKGGKDSEVSAKTKKILVEAANFDSVSIYRTSRAIDLVTDASARFAHGMSPHSVEIGLETTRVLLEEILGAKFVGAKDVYPNPQSKEIIGFSIERFNSIAGLELKKSEITKKLETLGFKLMPSKNKKDDFLVEVPPLRIDVTMFEDLVEEVVRLYGLDKLEPKAPVVSISQAKEEDSIILKDKVRDLLTSAGYTEVYNYSFVGRKTATSYELEKPIAENKKYLRQDISTGLKENLERNSRFFDEVHVFEIGNVFDTKIGERTFLGLGSKNAKRDPFLELKGAFEKLLHRLGVIEISFIPNGVDLEVKSDSTTLGIISIAGKDTATAELDMGEVQEIVSGEYEYRDIPKYPAIMRDISLELKTSVKVGDILNAIEGADAKNVVDVDLIDYYDDKRLTFRIVFQSRERTLKDSEVEAELGEIIRKLKKKFKLEIR